MRNPARDLRRRLDTDARFHRFDHRRRDQARSARRAPTRARRENPRHCPRGVRRHHEGNPLPDGLKTKILGALGALGALAVSLHFNASLSAVAQSLRARFPSSKNAFIEKKPWIM